MTALPPLEHMPGLPDVWQTRGGVRWHDAPLPRRWHRCHPWQVGYVGQRIERCACGAIRYHGSGSWYDRNIRRRRNA